MLNNNSIGIYFQEGLSLEATKKLHHVDTSTVEKIAVKDLLLKKTKLLSLLFKCIARLHPKFCRYNSCK